MNVLVTGGAGYIGSHAVLALLEHGHAVVAVDNLSRGHRGAIDVLETLGDLTFHEGDLGDRAAISGLLSDHEIDVVMHFGALAEVGESVREPLRYYENNTASTIALVAAMHDSGVNRIVFSSTAATYGVPTGDRIPIREDCPQVPINPYGRSKLFIEHMLRDHAAANEAFRFCVLRYFNVAGADPDGRIGEHHDPETHLVPICLQAALGQRPGIRLFGTDYETPDGTCIRDYVHVSDLAHAHLLAMDSLIGGAESMSYNVGIGRGFSVREIIDAVERVLDLRLDVTDDARRAGDPPVLVADGSRIRDELGWSPRFPDVDDAVASAWEWFRTHPHGYVGASPVVNSSSTAR